MRSALCSLLPLALVCAAPAYAESLELGEVQVRSEESSELEAAQARLHDVPGASNVVDLTRVENGRTASNTDVLAYQPGVYAQSSGNDGAKVSVRGSGIDRAPGAQRVGPICDVRRSAFDRPRRHALRTVRTLVAEPG